MYAIIEHDKVRKGDITSTLLEKSRFLHSTVNKRVLMLLLKSLGSLYASKKASLPYWAMRCWAVSRGAVAFDFRGIGSSNVRSTG